MERKKRPVKSCEGRKEKGKEKALNEEKEKIEKYIDSRTTKKYNVNDP